MRRLARWLHAATLRNLNSSMKHQQRDKQDARADWMVEHGVETPVRRGTPNQMLPKACSACSIRCRNPKSHAVP